MTGAVYMTPRRLFSCIHLLFLFRFCAGDDDEYKFVAAFSEPCTGEYSSELGPNERLYAEEEPHHICSPNGLNRFGIDPTGDLSLWRGPNKIWSAGTCCKGNGASVVMQISDGNLVVYASEYGTQVPLWSSGATSPNAILTVDDDGQARIRAGDVIAWETDISINDVVLAYYYPWYYAGDWSRHDYVGTPLLGEYGTDNITVAQRHVDWAADYGIDGFLVSWWGPESLTEEHLGLGLLNAPNLGRIRFAILYEAFGILDPVDGELDSITDFQDPAVMDRMIADFAHMKANFFSHDEYLRIDGKPLVALYVTRGFRNFDLSHVAQLEAAIGEDLYLVADEAFTNQQSSPDTAQNAGSFDAYCAYNMFVNNLVVANDTALTYMQREALPVFRNWAEQTTFLPGIMPSYHDFRGHEVLPGNADDFRQQIADMKELPYHPVSQSIDRIFLLTSFNEWFEGTTVEPTEEYGDSYLQVIHDNFGANGETDSAAKDPTPDGVDDKYEFVGSFSDPCTGEYLTELGPNERLYAEEEPHHICSPNGLYRFGMDPDGDLALWRGRNKVWSAGTSPEGTGTFVVMQMSDGNLVVRTSQNGSLVPLWSSGATSANAVLTVDDDGQARIKAGGDTSWETDAAPAVPTVSPRPTVAPTSQSPTATMSPTTAPTDVKPDCSWATGSSPSSGSEKSKPNVILLLTDDQDVVLGSLNDMPILKRVLMERGTNFRNAFVHTPICCPSRMSILSGRYLHNINEGNPVNNSHSGGCDGVNWRDDAELETFAMHAQAAGYVTSYSGKYLSSLGANIRGTPGCPACWRVPPGYDKWLAQMENAIYYDYGVIQSDNGGLDAWMTRHGRDYYKDYFPDLVANRTLAMIEEFTSGVCGVKKPYLAVAAWPTPHGPFTPAPWAEHMHDGVQAPRTPNYNASSEYMELKHWLVRKQSPINEDIAKNINKRHEMRLESLRSVDEHVGMIVDLLEKRGELDNTYIIYTSDNGFQGGQHRIPGDKRHLYENDIRVPFIVTGPGIPQNVETDRTVLNVDIAPTIYELMTGNVPPPTMDGSSIVPYLRSLKRAIENDDTTIDDPNQREDFLVSYYGEGNPECGLKVTDCSAIPPPTNFHVNDGFNNTYHCVRTLTTGEYQPISIAQAADKDSIYCRFDDSEQFVEYYDHTVDPWQLRNRANELSDGERAYFEARLAELRSCKGDECRELPSGSETDTSSGSTTDTSGTSSSDMVSFFFISTVTVLCHMILSAALFVAMLPLS